MPIPMQESERYVFVLKLLRDITIESNKQTPQKTQNKLPQGWLILAFPRFREKPKNKKPLRSLRPLR